MEKGYGMNHNREKDCGLTGNGEGSWEVGKSGDRNQIIKYNE